jgi:hypothetical protein
VLKLCQKAGMVKLGHAALDGTKVAANASLHKAMSYQRMKDEEERLTKLAAQLLREAEEVDAAEDARYGQDKRGDELPDELRDPTKRLERIKQLRAELEAEAKAQHEVARAAAADDDDDAAGDDDDDAPPTTTELPSHKIPTEQDGTPKPKAQRNFTDADSRVMMSGKSFVQAYNCQAAVDEAHQIVVAQAVTNQAPDAEHFVPMLEQVAANCGAHATRTTADAGYYSEARRVRAHPRRGRLHRRKAAETRCVATSRPWPTPQGPAPQGLDAATARDQGRPSGLCAPQGDGRAGLWADQAGPRHPQLPPARPRQGPR